MLPNFGLNFWIKTLYSRAAVRRPVLETERGIQRLPSLSTYQLHDVTWAFEALYL